MPGFLLISANLFGWFSCLVWLLYQRLFSPLSLLLLSLVNSASFLIVLCIHGRTIDITSEYSPVRWIVCIHSLKQSKPDDISRFCLMDLWLEVGYLPTIGQANIICPTEVTAPNSAIGYRYSPNGTRSSSRSALSRRLRALYLLDLRNHGRPWDKCVALW